MVDEIVTGIGDVELISADEVQFMTANAMLN